MDPRSGMTPWWSPQSVAAGRPAFMGVDGYVPPETAGIPGMAPPPAMPGNAPQMANQGHLGASMEWMPPTAEYAPMAQPNAPAPPPMEAPEDFGSDGGWFSGEAPRYGDGSTHPAWGGAPRGGPGDGSGGGPAQQVTVPSTGASAGPNGVRAPRDSGGLPTGGGGPTSGGGGGGGGSDMYNAMKERLLGGMFGSSTEEEGPSQAQYRRSQRQSTQDWRQYEREQQWRSAINAYNPLAQLPELYGGTPSVGAMTMWESMPMEQLALATLGANKDKRYIGSAQGGRRYQQDLNDLYASLVTPGAFDREQAMSNIFGAGKNTLLGQSFMTRETPESRYSRDGLYQGMKKPNAWNFNSPSAQANNLIGLVGAVEGVGRSQEHQATVEGALERLLLGFQNQQGIRRPDNTKSIRDWVGKHGFGG